jgi:hypothetical protein
MLRLLSADGLRISPMRYLFYKSLLIALLYGTAGCGLVQDPAPDSADVRIDGQAGDEVRLVISTEFLAGVDFGTIGDPTLEVIGADTLRVSLPFADSYDIRQDQRFLAQVLPLADTLGMDAVQLRGAIDGEERFNRTATPVDSLLQFVYVYRGSNPPAGGRL